MADNAVNNYRTLGIALLATAILFMIGAWSAAYFRRFPLPTDPLEKLKLIADDRVGWTAQAIIFPVAFLATTIIAGLVALQMDAGLARWLAWGATLLFAAALLFWLPISIGRLQLGANSAEMIRTYNPAAPPQDMPSSTFWLHTVAMLAAVALFAAALALEGVLPKLGWIMAAIAAASILIAVFVWHDWPPFMSYVWLLVIAIGLI
jgi:hypothetical protein